MTADRAPASDPETSQRESLDRETRCAADAARAAGRILLAGLPLSEKGARAKSYANDPVTVYDERAQQEIVRILSAAFPRDGILSEEHVDSPGTSGRRWLIDPLDGTNNFLTGIPHFAVSIALEAEGRTVLGCIHDPVREETFTAQVEVGAHLNAQPMRPSDRTELDGSVLGLGLSHAPERRARLIARLGPLIRRAGVVRTLGSAALDLAYVAAGRFDAACYLALDAWDVAAAALLIDEAGGRISDLHGDPMHDPRQGLAASNGLIHDAFVHALA